MLACLILSQLIIVFFGYCGKMRGDAELVAKLVAI